MIATAVKSVVVLRNGPTVCCVWVIYERNIATRIYEWNASVFIRAKEAQIADKTMTQNKQRMRKMRKINIFR